MTNEEFLRSISLEGEVWKDVVGYEGLYVVSNFGRVCALERIITTKAGWNRTHHATLMKPRRNSIRGTHLAIHLCKNAKHKPEYVHRMVALAFISNPHNHPLVEHLDCDPTNNHISNLRWTTQTGNMNNPITLKRMSESQKRKVLSMLRKPIVRIKHDGSIKHYESMTAASKDGFNTGGISSACNGKIKQSQGYRWMFLSDYEASNQ